MKQRYLFLLIFLLSTTLYSQIRVQMVDSLRKPNFWIAAGGVTAVNLTVWSVDCYVLNHPWARINGKSILNNIQTGFTWDTDNLQVNMFDHPFHGSVYFNTARASGLDYWHAIPLTAFGSFTWEFFAETEHAAINDFISTTVGGIALGEMFHRLSYALWDESSTGFGRFGREFGGLLLNPARGLTRLINGDAYRVRRVGYRAHRPSIPMLINLSSGIKAIQISSDAGGKYEAFPMIGFDMEYNDVFNLDDNPKPFDFFRFRMQFNISQYQPAISLVHGLGLIAGKEVDLTENHSLFCGISQNFTYYDSESASKKKEFIPYKLAIPASFGIGGKYVYHPKATKWELATTDHINGVLLGGVLSDYFRNEARNYNFGSGFSITSYNHIRYGKRWFLNLDAELYRLYTWQGFNPKLDYSNIDPNRWNMQGDVSQTSLLIFRPTLRFMPRDHWSINLSASHYRRNTRYKYYDNKEFDTYEFFAQLVYYF